MTENVTREDRALGCFRGLAVGDALGAPVEFKARGTFIPVTDFRPTTHFKLPAGVWTDDTIMAMCLTDALLSDGGYASHSVMERYLGWYLRGDHSYHERCFDIGNRTAKSLDFYHQGFTTLRPGMLNNDSGNGTVMRLAPVALVSTNLDDASAEELFRISAADTHYAVEAMEATAIFGFILRSLILGASLNDAIHASYALPDSSAIKDRILHATESTVHGGGYVIDTLAAALWAVRTTDSFAEAVLAAVNLGDDADTVGAVTGQLAGALYGDTSIPMHWRDGLYRGDEFPALSQRLLGVRCGVTSSRIG